MTAEAPMSLPGSRILLGWWRELAPIRPRRLWFAHALLHRVEALVEVSGRSPLEELRHALLAQVEAAPHDLSALALPAGVLSALLGRLASDDLLAPKSLTLTDAGRAALAHGPVARPERRAFPFLDGLSPHFLSISPTATLPLSPPPGWRFDLSNLESAIARPDDWKARHGFPADVVRLLPPPPEPTAQDSPRAPVDRAEQAYLVLAESGRDGGRVLGFAVRPDAWALPGEAAVSVPSVAALEEVIGETSAAWWRPAWQTWCQQRSLPVAEVEACRLEPTDHRLIVHAPPRLVERLRQGRSEATRGEAWLLAGTGRYRAAASIELVES